MTTPHMPLVSVCIGVYNREPYLRECLDSVFAQTYPHLEVIVVDDASTDNSLNILRSYGSRIRLVERKENSGMCPITRNQAVRLARGEFVALLDSDDMWYPEKVETQVNFLRANPGIPLCHTYCHVIDGQSRVVGIRHEANLPPTGNYFVPLLRHCWITISTVMMRRTLYDEIGPFNEDAATGIWGEDHEYFLRVSRKHSVGLIDQVLAAYRKSNVNISAGNWKQLPESLPFHAMILQRRDLWEGLVSRREVRQALLDICLENAEYWRHQGFPGRAWWSAWQGLKHSPCHPGLWSTCLKALIQAARRSDGERK